jgi:hypothetical protein
LGFSVLVCLAGLKLGFGSFQEPSAGFMPVLAGSFLGLLAIVGLISGIRGQGKAKSGNIGIWHDTDWKRLISTIVALFIYTAAVTRLGYLLGTTVLLLFLFRVAESRPWWIVLIAASLTAGLSYLVFKIGLDAQLPKGFLGF